ncbi:MAG: carbohydrate binding family 9 domain-containing protein [Sphingomonas sp.]
MRFKVGSFKSGLVAAATLLPVAAHAANCEQIAPQPANAAHTTAPITFDGRLEETDWQRATPLNKFYEDYPLNCATPPEATDIRFLYDDQYLYVGIRASLHDASKLRKPFVRRDKVGSSHDYVQVYLDPLGTRRSSYLFRVSARGVETDGLQDEGKQTESVDPDFTWEVHSAIDDKGWTAELKIPLSTLRIAHAGKQDWTVIATRGVPRDQNTQMATAPFPRNNSCFLCHASTLSFADLAPHTEHVIVTPSISASVRRDSGVMGHGDHFHVQPSLDAKWLPYAGAAVDLTIHPDFSQVEADSPQLSANNRFAINLPEKRPFFREGSDLIGTPLPVLYTRTIAAPDYGLRFTHRSTSINGTAFFAQDGGRPAIIEPGLLSSTLGLPDFDSKVGFAHVVAGFGTAQGGALGAIKTNSDGSYNVVGGFDGSWATAKDHVFGQVTYSATRNPNRADLVSTWLGQHESGAAALAQWDHTSTLVWSLRYTRYDPGFRSWLGYVPRVGYQDEYALVQRPYYFTSKFLNSVAPYAKVDLLEAIGARGYERDPAIGTSITGAHNLNIDVSYHPDTVVLTEQGAERHTSSIQWTAFFNPVARVPLIELDGLAGRQVDFATGDVVPALTLSAIARTRPLDRLELEARYSLSRLGGASGGGTRLNETIREVLATYFLAPDFYILADAQFYYTERLFPTVERDRSSLISVQASWKVTPKLQSYFGVRSGAQQPEVLAARGRSTEVYLKLSRRLAF